MSKEAMKLALEALEEAWYHVGTFQPTEKAIDLYDEARTALREALAEQPAQQALDKMAENARDLGLDYEHPTQYWRAHASDYERGVIDGMQKQMQSSVDRAVNAMAEQPAQQEPVAGLLVGQDSDGRYVSIAAKAHADTLPLGEYKLYTSPPAQRTWVGLTDEEKRQIFEREDYQGWLDYINAIEAKLKEKNT